MGKLLEKAFAEASKLPDAEQESAAKWFLAELEAERRWDDLFARSPDLLQELAREAIREDESGLTEPLDPDDM